MIKVKSGIRKILLVLMLMVTVGMGASFCYGQDWSKLEYEGKAYTAVNDNVPFFTDKQKNQGKSSYERYGDLDSKGRCTAAMASVGRDIMPKGERGDISAIHPTGWQSGMGWERCHLLGWQLTGEDANERNLITGTHYFNVTGMLPFENMVADYVKENPGNHVLYRVTPVFRGDELVARGVLMEGWSVEDKGEDVCFNVYVFNVDPDGEINYMTGKATGSDTSDSGMNLLEETYSHDCRNEICDGLIREIGLAVAKHCDSRENNNSGSRDSLENSNGRQLVYWTPSGSVYHLEKDCPALANSSKILKGTVDRSGKSRACARCK